MKFRGSYLNYIILYFFYFFVMGSFGAIMSIYLQDIGKAAWEISLILSASSIFSFVTVPLFGYITDRTHKRRLLSAIAVVTAGILGIVFSLQSSLWLLFILNGVTMSLISCVMQVCERMAGNTRYRYGYIRVIGTVGYAASIQVAGFIFGNYPSRYVFYIMLLASLIAAAGFMSTDPAEQDASVASEKQFFRLKGLSKAFADKNFAIYLFTALLLAGISGTNMTYSPLLLSSLGVDTTLIGTILSIGTLVEIPVIVFSNKFMDRFSSKHLLRLNFVIMAFQFLCYSFISSAGAVIFISVAVKSIASTLFVLINSKIIRTIISPALTTTALGISSSFASVGVITIQNISGVITDRSSITTMYLILSIIAVAGIFLSSFIKVKNTAKLFS